MTEDTESIEQTLEKIERAASIGVGRRRGTSLYDVRLYVDLEQAREAIHRMKDRESHQIPNYAIDLRTGIQYSLGDDGVVPQATVNIGDIQLDLIIENMLKIKYHQEKANDILGMLNTVYQYGSNTPYAQ